VSHESPSLFRSLSSTLPALVILLLTVSQGTGEIVLARMIAAGESLWPGYAQLRTLGAPPDCDPEQIGNAAPASSERDLIDELIGGAPATPPSDDDALIDDLVGEARLAPTDAAPAEAEPPAAPPSDEDLIDVLVGGSDPSAPDADASQRAAAVQAAREQCLAAHAEHLSLRERLTPAVEAWVGADHALEAFTDWARELAKGSLALLVVVCGLTATLVREHIALRPVHSARDNQVSSLAALFANLLVSWSCWQHYTIQTASEVDIAQPWIALVWSAGFAAMAASNLDQLASPPATLRPGGALSHALLTPPLYATMTVISAVWFFGVQQHPSGLAIQLERLTEQAALYVQVGLYVWAGMLLKRTALAHLCFDVLRPWRLAPELLAAVTVVLASIPTAYSGASGIFVIAAGAVIYEELRRAGARNQLALAATAMSGSLGVVLSPCLLVVIVAAMNRQVTTSELYGAGRWVFLLTAGLFVLALLLTRDGPLTVAPAAEALPESRAALRRLLPYAALTVAVILGYGAGLNAWINEHNAARILLVLLLSLLLLERWLRPAEGPGLLTHVRDATAETTGHIGALLLLMAMSVAFGGVIEQADVMSLAPERFDSPALAIAVLTATLVVIGMVMDPYGAVILVSGTLAQVADASGVSALHFWMVVLVAFELGYLTPPVALNHLLTRAVVGDAADADDLPPGAPWWRRHERYTLPMLVMSTALVIVAVGGLFVWPA
jgi:TRAP-type C4-dicarboxylate transport system permease large subunit